MPGVTDGTMNNEKEKAKTIFYFYCTSTCMVNLTKLSLLLAFPLHNNVMEQKVELVVEQHQQEKKKLSIFMDRKFWRGRELEREAHVFLFIFLPSSRYHYC